MHHVQAQRHLRAAKTRELARRGGLGARPRVRLRSVGWGIPLAARRHQMHPLHALRRRMRQGAALLGVGDVRPCGQSGRAGCRRCAHRRCGLCSLRPVHHPLSDGRPHCARRHRQRARGACRSPDDNGGPGRARHPLGVGRGRGPCPRAGHAGPHGVGIARARLRLRLRHRLRRRPHHYGGSERVHRMGQGRQAAAHVHELLPGLGALRQAALLAVCRAALLEQVPAPDAGRHGEGASVRTSCRTGKTHLRRLRYAVRRQEIRGGRPSAVLGGWSGCRCRAHHARVRSHAAHVQRGLCRAARAKFRRPAGNLHGRGNHLRAHGWRDGSGASLGRVLPHGRKPRLQYMRHHGGDAR